MNELVHWRPIPGYDYEVSDTGLIRRVVSGGWRIGRVVKPYARKDGYLTVGLYGPDRRQHTLYVHALVCEAFRGPAPSPAHEVAHLDGKPANNLISNLIWATTTENHGHKRLHGTRRAGVEHPMVRIDEAIVIEIFRLRGQGKKLSAIAEAFGLHLAHVGDILNRKVWADVVVPEHLLSAARAVRRAR